jgi:hypothetical protein
MQFSMSQASLPVFEVHLNVLSAILDKAEAYAAAKKSDPAVLLHSRLSPDMFDLARQVQVATDSARRRGAPRRRRQSRKNPASGDAEFSRNPILGAKTNSEEYGFRIVHEATYALTTQDFTPAIDSVAESGCDLLFLCSYLEDSIGLVRAIHAHPFRPKMVGASMIGPQNTAVKTTLGPLLNVLRLRQIILSKPSQSGSDDGYYRTTDVCGGAWKRCRGFFVCGTRSRAGSHLSYRFSHPHPQGPARRRCAFR